MDLSLTAVRCERKHRHSTACRVVGLSLLLLVLSAGAQACRNSILGNALEAGMETLSPQATPPPTPH